MIKRLVSKLSNGMYRDFILSLLASAVTTVSVQLIVYPVLAKMCSPSEYGRILTIMGIGNVITVAAGNSLNNVRLVMNADYEENRIKGDFLPVLFFLGLAGTLSFLLYLILGGERSILSIILLCCFALFGILVNYGSVAFRIKINYKKNLILCICMASGNLLGLLFFFIFRNIGLWSLSFALSQVAGIAYLFLGSDIFKEPVKTTKFFCLTVRKETILLITTICANVLVYLDRLLLYPLLGGEAVSTYTVASFFGKSLSILMNPISSVLLSYYSQRNFGMNRRVFWKINGITLGMAVAFMIVCFLCSEWITGLLYPTIIESAKPYLLIANLAAVINVVGNMVSPAVLKFAPTVWQALNQIVYMALYLGAGILLSNKNGLMGFSFAALMAGIIRLCIFCVVGHVFIPKEVRNA